MLTTANSEWSTHCRLIPLKHIAKIQHTNETEKLHIYWWRSMAKLYAPLIPIYIRIKNCLLLCFLTDLRLLTAPTATLLRFHFCFRFLRKPFFVNVSRLLIHDKLTLHNSVFARCVYVNVCVLIEKFYSCRRWFGDVCSGLF